MVARSASHIDPEPSPPGNGGAGEIVVEDHFLDDPGAAGIRAAMNQIRQRRRHAVDVPVIASRTNVTPTSVAGGYTILESVKPFRTALEGHDSNVCLQDLRDLAVEFRRQLHAQLQQSGSNQLWPSFDATKRDMFGGN